MKCGEEKPACTRYPTILNRLQDCDYLAFLGPEADWICSSTDPHPDVYAWGEYARAIKVSRLNPPEQSYFVHWPRPLQSILPSNHMPWSFFSQIPLHNSLAILNMPSFRAVSYNSASPNLPSAKQLPPSASSTNRPPGTRSNIHRSRRGETSYLICRSNYTMVPFDPL